MKVLGLLGWSGSGKTHLLTRLLPLLIARGLSVSTVKHAHHGFDLDQPGKDSYQHRAAGAREVLIASGRRWALLHELNEPEPPLSELLARMSPVDLVLVEGFKSNPHPKIEVFRPSLGHAPFWPERTDVVAVATDDAITDCPLPLLDLGQPAVIAVWCLGFLGLTGDTDDAAQPDS
jgi:molybdopterin-guanine dinucleotide biosynthesis protein MobB